MKRHRVVLGALALLIIALVALLGACGGNKSNPMSAGGGADVTITIVARNGNMSFSPNPASCPVGKKVAWRNNGGMTHTATSDPSGAAFNTGDIANGASSAPITMGTTGTFPYHCARHPDMTGTLSVTGP